MGQLVNSDNFGDIDILPYAISKMSATENKKPKLRFSIPQILFITYLQQLDSNDCFWSDTS